MSRIALRNEGTKVGDVIKSVCGAIITIVIGSAIASYLIIMEIIREEWLTYAVMSILVLSGICGSVLMINNKERKIWLSLVSVVTVIICLMLIQITVFHGPLQNALKITFALLSGNCIGMLIKRGKGREKKRMHVKRSR